MPTIAWVLIVLLALVAGAVGGFFLARRYMMKYLVEQVILKKGKF